MTPIRFYFSYFLISHFLHKKSFTLIEMLIVVAIIGILAAALVPRIKNAENRAKISKTTVDMRTISIRVYQAQLNTNQYLGQITNNYWTAGSCSQSGSSSSYISTPRYELPSNHVCRGRRQSAIDKIASAAGEGSGTQFYTDARGSPYYLDENEGEYPIDLCRIDLFTSVGADGLYYTSNDNLRQNLRHYKCPGGY